MALRTYTDKSGVEWRVWRVAPDSISFSTLGENYRDGWLCFERVDGTDRRRLSMSLVPADWDSFDEHRLDALCRAADPGMRRPTPPGRSEGVDTTAFERAKRRD